MDTQRTLTRIFLTVALSLTLGISALAQSANRAVVKSRTAPGPMPAELAGEIAAPSGQIALIRGGDIYIMNIDGSNLMLACASGNAHGRLSWAPGNRFIAFSRRGQVELKAPDNLGGKHRVYDVFKVVMDSVGINSDWWLRVTEDLGGRYPEWSADGATILFTKDYNAFLADAVLPNYQMTLCNPDGGEERPLRKDYQQTDLMAINPTAGPNDRYAFIAFYDLKPQGLAITETGKPMMTIDEIKKQVRGETNVIGPSWSPDGQWIAYINNDINRPAIYLISPDRSQKYLLYKPAAGLAPSANSIGWSHDSKWVTFATNDGAIWICDITGGQLKPVLGPGPNASPAWSKGVQVVD